MGAFMSLIKKLQESNSDGLIVEKMQWSKLPSVHSVGVSFEHCHIIHDEKEVRDDKQANAYIMDCIMRSVRMTREFLPGSPFSLFNSEDANSWINLMTHSIVYSKSGKKATLGWMTEDGHQGIAYFSHNKNLQWSLIGINPFSINGVALIPKSAARDMSHFVKDLLQRDFLPYNHTLRSLIPHEPGFYAIYNGQKPVYAGYTADINRELFSTSSAISSHIKKEYCVTFKTRVDRDAALALRMALNPAH